MKVSKQEDRRVGARKFAQDAAKLLATTRCTNVVMLDVTGLSPVCDYFVIGTGTSPRQMRSVADDVDELATQHNFAPIGMNGDGGAWILVDCVDVVIHLFADEARRFYDLDNLWGDAKRVEWE